MPDSNANPRFIADAMLGKLARWLRLLGYDTRYSQDDDAAIANCARAEGRILLTRDRGLAARRGLNAILIVGTDLETQLAQVHATVGIPPMPPRCMDCNVRLHPIAPEAARSQVPAYVAQTQSDFQQCPKCGRILWPGTHWQGIARRLRRALNRP